MFRVRCLFWSLPTLAERLSTRSCRRAAQLAACALLLLPVAANAQTTFVSPVGSKSYFQDCGYKEECAYEGLHAGVDLLGQGAGTPVRAMADGQVVAAGWNDGFGYYVILRHELTNNGVLYSLVGHEQAAPPVKVGDCVTRGTELGKMGSTGASSGPHTHTEVRTFPEAGGGYAPDPDAEGYLNPLTVMDNESYLAKQICSKPPAWAASFRGHELPPLLKPGQCSKFAIFLANTGAEIWRPGEVSLGTQTPQDAAFIYATSEWGAGKNRVPLVNETPPGATGRFEVRYCIPANGKFPNRVLQYWDVVAEGKAHFGGEMKMWTIFAVGDETHIPWESGDYNARLIAQDPVAAEVHPGDKLCLRATFENAHFAWYFSGGSHPVRLRGTGPNGEINDRSSGFLDPEASNLVGRQGVNLDAAPVPGGTRYGVSLSIKVPEGLAAGVYNETWRAVAEAKSWFGATVTWSFRVTSGPSTQAGDGPACERKAAPPTPNSANPEPPAQVQAPAPDPCPDRAAPLSLLREQDVSRKRGRLSVKGLATDFGCDGLARQPDDPAGLKEVYLSVAKVERSKKRGGLCRFLSKKGRLGRVRSCQDPVLLVAQGTSQWRLSLKTKPPRGAYRINVRAVDASGNREKPRLRQNVVRLTVR